MRHVLRHEVWRVSGCPEGNVHRGRIQDVPQLDMLQLVAAICLSKVGGLLLSHVQLPAVLLFRVQQREWRLELDRIRDIQQIGQENIVALVLTLPCAHSRVDRAQILRIETHDSPLLRVADFGLLREGCICPVAPLLQHSRLLFRSFCQRTQKWLLHRTFGVLDLRWIVGVENFLCSSLGSVYVGFEEVTVYLVLDCKVLSEEDLLV